MHHNIDSVMTTMSYVFFCQWSPHLLKMELSYYTQPAARQTVTVRWIPPFSPDVIWCSHLRIYSDLYISTFPWGGGGEL